MTTPTRLTALKVDENLQTGGIVGKVVKLSKAKDYALEEKNAILINATMTAESKVLTLGLAENQMVIVKNAGATNAFTVKNIATDTGTSLAVGKSLLVFASNTEDESTVIALD